MWLSVQRPFHSVSQLPSASYSYQCVVSGGGLPRTTVFLLGAVWNSTARRGCGPHMGEGHPTGVLNLPMCHCWGPCPLSLRPLTERWRAPKCYAAQAACPLRHALGTVLVLECVTACACVGEGAEPWPSTGSSVPVPALAFSFEGRVSLNSQGWAPALEHPASAS